MPETGEVTCEADGFVEAFVACDREVLVWEQNTPWKLADCHRVRIRFIAS